MKERIKLYAGICTRSILKLLYPFLKIKKNRIIFCSYNGEQYSCNPKYISEYLNLNYKDEFEIIWVFNNPNKFKELEVNSNIKIVKNKSFKWIFFTMTSKFGITNTGVNSFIPLRKRQCFINTWHGGGCYKRVEGSDAKKSNDYILKIKTVAEMTSIYLSSSEFFSTNVIKDGFLYSGEILKSGMPRNDILFKENSFIKEKVRKKLNISSEDVFVVLYAPTWRKVNEKINTELDFVKLKSSIERKYNKKCILLYRTHHFSKKPEYTDGIINASEYDDMQELMCLSDMLITDFSSCMWDYSFTYKPCLLFIPDLDEYRRDVGFEMDIYKWGFPISLSNDELCKKILQLDSREIKDNMKKHHNMLGSYENGYACKMICEKIRSYL